MSVGNLFRRFLNKNSHALWEYLTLSVFGIVTLYYPTQFCCRNLVPMKEKCYKSVSEIEADVVTVLNKLPNRNWESYLLKLFIKYLSCSFIFLEKNNSVFLDNIFSLYS